MTTPSEERLLKIFDQYNADSAEGSETLDKSEAIAALLTLFPNEKAAKIVRRINTLDRNSDGELTKEEFLAVGSKFYFTYEERLLAFAAKYRSAGLAETDEELLRLLESWKGDEEELIDRMIDSYGPEPEKDEVDQAPSRAQPKPEQQDSDQISRTSSFMVVPVAAAPAVANNQSINRGDESRRASTGRRGSASSSGGSSQASKSDRSVSEDSETGRPRRAAAAAANGSRSLSESYVCTPTAEEIVPEENVPPPHVSHHNRPKRTGRNYFGFKRRY